jgi:hypothetical protein
MRVQPLFELLPKCLDAFPVHSTRPAVGFDSLPGNLQVLPLVHLINQRVGLSRPRRIDPVRQSPWPVMFGSFAQGTLHLIDLAHLARCLSPTVIACRLPRPTPVADRSVTRLSPRFRYYSAVRPLAKLRPPLRCSLIGLRIAASPAHLHQFSRGHGLLFRVVPPAHTLVRWLNENAFASIVQARPCPTFGRPVHLRSSLHRLRPDTSPHALRSSPRSEHPALQGSRLGQRGITPVFGYGAPHSSARGT